MPRPPPPADALRISGYPMCAASLASSSSPSTTPSLPGMVGKPAVFTSRRARSFSPIISMSSGFGPINVISDASQTLARREEKTAGFPTLSGGGGIGVGGEQAAPKGADNQDSLTV